MAALNSDVGEGQQVEAKPKSRPSKSKGEATLKQKSPAEFFAENKNIAGFDNVTLSLARVCSPQSVSLLKMPWTQLRRLEFFLKYKSPLRRSADPSSILW